MTTLQRNTAYSLLFWLQGLYFAITGLWPIVHLNSFMAVTGPKTDTWLVQTVGIVLAVIGVSLCAAGRQASINSRDIIPSAVLAIGSALALATVDIVFVSRGTISGIYLMDAVAEIALILAWIVTAFQTHRWHKSHTNWKHLAVAWR